MTEADWQRWTAADLTPYVQAALDLFGPGRLHVRQRLAGVRAGRRATSGSTRPWWKRSARSARRSGPPSSAAPPGPSTICRRIRRAAGARRWLLDVLPLPIQARWAVLRFLPEQVHARAFVVPAESVKGLCLEQVLRIGQPRARPSRPQASVRIRASWVGLARAGAACAYRATIRDTRSPSSQTISVSYGTGPCGASTRAPSLRGRGRSAPFLIRSARVVPSATSPSGPRGR